MKTLTTEVPLQREENFNYVFAILLLSDMRNNVASYIDLATNACNHICLIVSAVTLLSINNIGAHQKYKYRCKKIIR